MSAAELTFAAVGTVGGLGGLGALAGLLRARAQNGLDQATGRKAEAEAEAIEVRTARELIAEVRAEMDRRVSNLDREIGRVRGLLEATRRERDHLAQTEAQLREENRQLRSRIDSLEARIAELTAELAAVTASPSGPTVRVAVEAPRLTS